MPLITEDAVAFDVNGGGGGGGDFSVSFFNPRVVYGIAGEALRIYPRNLCPDRSVSLASDFTRTDEEFIPVNAPVAGTTTIAMRGRRGTQLANLGTFDLIIGQAPVNPATPLNVIIIGDSTSAQYDDDGASINELSRRLTGVGRSIADSAVAAGFTWAGPSMPPPFNLTNIIFRGTLGTQAVKHEGRSGWRSSIYTSMATASGKTNAFWDPVGERFSMTYYVNQNGFGIADDVVNGIQPNGSNLLVIIALGWNDVYREDDSAESAAVAATNLALLIDEIHADMPNARVLVPGLNPPARVNLKGLSTKRFISQQEVFEVAIKGYGNAFRDVCDARANTDFYPIASTFDPEIAYGISTFTRNFRSTETFQGAGDYVHSRPPGYAMWADSMCHWIINQYCQP